MADQLNQVHQKYYADGTETGSVAISSEDQSVVIINLADLGVTKLQRFLISYTGTTLGGTTSITPQLEYRKNGGAWTAVNASSSNVRSKATSNIADGANTTARLTAPSGGPWAFSGVAQFDEVNGATAAITLKIPDPGVPTNGTYTEPLFAFEFRLADLAHNDLIELRVTNAGVALGSYSTAMVFAISRASGGAWFLLT